MTLIEEHRVKLQNFQCFFLELHISCIGLIFFYAYFMSCRFSCAGLDQHGPHDPESDPGVVGPHVHGPPASRVPLHQSADLSCDRPQSEAGGARVARASGARL